VQSVDISEGCAASGINNALREIMTDLKNVSTGAVALETPAADQLNVDNIRIDGNTISSTDTNGDITLDPDGTGRVAVTGSTTMTGTDTFNSAATGSGILLKDSGVTSRQLHIAAPGSVSEAVIGTPNSHNLTFATNNTERMRILSNGQILIGCTSSPSSSVAGFQISPSLDLEWSRSGTSNSGATRHIGFYNTNGLVGDIITNGSATSFQSLSDYRAKENVAALTGAIDRVKQLAPKRYNFISDPDTTFDGFLAHEAQAVVPESASGTKDAVDGDGNPDMQGLDASKLVPLLTGALQEAIAKIETLETQRADLETRLTALENA